MMDTEHVQHTEDIDRGGIDSEDIDRSAEIGHRDTAVEGTAVEGTGSEETGAEDVERESAAAEDLAPEPVGAEESTAEDTPVEDVTARDIRAENNAATSTVSGADDTTALFAADEADKYLSDWHAVQASFVDDPQAAVSQAEALVGQFVDTMTARISERRATLSAQRTSTEGERTEQLRLTLRGYRALLLQLLPAQR